MKKGARNIVGILAFAAASSSQAADFHPIASIASSTQATDLFPVFQLIDGPGLGFEASEPHDATGAFSNHLWVTRACPSLPCDYFGSFPDPVLTIDLGQDRKLDEISIWGYADSNNNGGKNFRMRFATELEGIGNFASSISYSPTFTAVNETTKRQSFAFGQVVTARYLEITITDNFFIPPGTFGGDRVGLGEIAFEVPESNFETILTTVARDFTSASGPKNNPLLTANDLDGNFWAAEIDPSTGDIYFSIPTEGKISVATFSDDPLILRDFKTVPGAVFHGLAIDAVSRTLYALDSATDAIIAYHLDTGAETATLGTGTFTRPNDIVFDARRSWLVVTDSGEDKVFVFDTGGNLVHTLDHSSTAGAWGVAVDPANQDIIYSSHDLGEIRRWTPGSMNDPIQEESGLSGPRGLRYDRWGRLYCMQSGTRTVVTFGPSPLPVYTLPITAATTGGREVTVFAPSDLNGNLIPDAWESEQMLSGLSFYGDRDGDGTLDGIEAALDGSASGALNASGFRLGPDGDSKVTLTHQALKQSQFDYLPYLSDDLEGWQPVSSLGKVTAGPDGSLYDTLTIGIDPAAEGFSDPGKLFVRFKIIPVER